jgi:hypothetical protein
MSDNTAPTIEDLASKLAYYLSGHAGEHGLSLKLAEHIVADHEGLVSVFMALNEAFMAARSAFYEAQDDEDSAKALWLEADKAYDKVALILLPVFRGFLPNAKAEFEAAEAEYNTMATPEEQALAEPKVDDLYSTVECLEHSISRLLPITPAASGGGGGGGGGYYESDSEDEPDYEPYEDHDDEPICHHCGECPCECHRDCRNCRCYDPNCSGC